MSVEQDVPSNTVMNVNRQEEGHVVIDAVHKRFRRRDTIMDSSDKIYIYCDDCNSKISWDDVAIKNHFNDLHSSRNYCRYCRGKVFIYRKIIIMNGKETSDEIVYHKCNDM